MTKGSAGRRHRRQMKDPSQPGQNPRERLAARIGHAIEEFGAAGGNLSHASESLLRYAAQCHMLDNGIAEGFTANATSAFIAELGDIQARAKRGGSA